MITQQELLNDLKQTLEILILKALNNGISIYIKPFKTFGNTRLKQATAQYTTLALMQLHQDLANLCVYLNPRMFAEEIDWLLDRARTIEKMVK